MVVPVPGRRQDDIPPLHLDPATMDSRETALAFNYEPHRKGSVAVSFGHLIWHN